MRTKISFLSALVLISVNAMADGLTATLQQGDRMTPFYGVDAFKQAISIAEDGAIITLSAGAFTNDNDTIRKSVRIVGNYGMSSNSVERTVLKSLTVSADDVTIDGIYFLDNVTLGNVEDCKIVHSWVEGKLTYLSEDIWHTNTIVDQCVLKNEQANRRGKEYTIKNSTIEKFTAFNSKDNPALFVNNSIYYFFESNTSYTSMVVLYEPYIPCGIYKNNVLEYNLFYYSGYRYVRLESPSEFYNNVFINVYSYSSAAQIQYSNNCQNSNNIFRSYPVHLSGYPALPENLGNGDDGTLVGPNGGTGFSYYPSIPRITSKTISPYCDKNGKLNVKITVESK